MPSYVALALWAVAIIALVRFDPSRPAKSSWALWVPITEFFILGSRLPSAWLGAHGAASASQALVEGSPVDRLLRLALMATAIIILSRRGVQLQRMARRNVALVTLLAFALLSTLWSDFPFVALKRWVRDLDAYLAVLIIVSEARPAEAFGVVFRRVLYVLLSLSVVLVKYFPALGRSYDEWTGRPFYSGVATSKNMLGLLCILGGMFFFWQLVTSWRNRGSGLSRRAMAVDAIFLGMALWLLNLADSATSKVCLGLGCAMIAAAHTRLALRRPMFIRGLVPVVLGVPLIAALVFGVDVTREIATTLGRDPTLTDRTYIWKMLLGMDTSPLFGVGYESFWLGATLEKVWRSYGMLNQAHNGYLHVYLNLGLIGLSLVIAYLVSAYVSVCRRPTPPSELGTLGLALWLTLVVYNVTEAAFLGGLLWVALTAIVLSPGDAGLAATEPVSRRPSGHRPIGRRGMNGETGPTSAEAPSGLRGTRDARANAQETGRHARRTRSFSSYCETRSPKCISVSHTSSVAQFRGTMLVAASTGPNFAAVP